MSVLLSAVVISLLPAAVGFTTAVKITFGGALIENVKKTVEIQHSERQRCEQQFSLFYYFTVLYMSCFCFFSLIGVQNIQGELGVGCHRSS